MLLKMFQTARDFNNGLNRCKKNRMLSILKEGRQDANKISHQMTGIAYLKVKVKFDLLGLTRDNG